MEKKLNNADVLGYGYFNKGQIFFIQRWLELLNTHTHSRYSVRYLNSHQALIETLYVCKGILNEEINSTGQHLKLVFEEANKIILEDKVLSKYADNQAKILRSSLQDVPRNGEKAKIHSVIYRLEYVVRYLNENYLEWIVKEANDSLSFEQYNEEDLREIEIIMKTLASELIGRGWSLSALYSLIKETVLNLEGEDGQGFDQFFERVLSKPTTYIYLFAVKSGMKNETKRQLEQFGAELLKGKSVLDVYEKYDLKQNVSENKEYIYISNEAIDLQSGINKAWQKVAEYIDVLQFYGFQLPDIATEPIVLLPGERGFIRNIQVNLIDRKRKFRASKSMMDKVKNQLNRKTDEVNRKIRSLFEFTRISDESMSPQSTFLNLWIAIESFVRTEEYDGNIESVRNILATSATHNYPYGLLKNFLQDCNRCNLEIEIGGQLIKVGKLTPHESITILLDDKNEHEIEEACYNLNYLLGYRFKELKYVLKDGKNSARMLQSHKKNIEQHIQRLYRVRNSIVHSGEVHYNINLFIKHMHEYLEQTMSVVIYRLEDHPHAKLEETFAQVRDSVDTTIETLKNSKHLDQEAYYRLLLKGAF